MTTTTQPKPLEALRAKGANGRKLAAVLETMSKPGWSLGDVRRAAKPCPVTSRCIYGAGHSVPCAVLSSVVGEAAHA